MKKLFGALLLLGLCTTALKAASDQPVKQYKVSIASFTSTGYTVGQDIWGSLRLYKIFLVNTSTNTFAVTLYDGETAIDTFVLTHTSNIDRDYKNKPIQIKTGVRLVHTSETNNMQQNAIYEYRRFSDSGGNQASRIYYTTISSGICTAISNPCFVEQVFVSSVTTAQTLSLRNGTGGDNLIQMYLPATVPSERDYSSTPLYFPGGVGVISSASAEGAYISIKYSLAVGSAGGWRVATSTAVALGADSTNNIGDIDIEVSDIYFESQSTAATQYIYNGKTEVLRAYEADDTNLHIHYDPYVVFTSSVGFYSSSATTPPKVITIYRRN